MYRGGGALMAAPTIRRTTLVGTWSIIAPGRSGRPGLDAPAPDAARSGCPFCEGNEAETMAEVFALRPSGSVPNGPGWTVRVVPNKYPALRSPLPALPSVLPPYEETPGRGYHEVVIDAPDHRRLSEFSVAQLEIVLSVYRSRIEWLSRQPGVESIWMFRNDGRAAGASQEHPHTQILALPLVPDRLRREIAAAAQHVKDHGRCPTCAILDREVPDGSLFLSENVNFAALVSFAGRFPYETCILPKAHGHDFAQMSSTEISSLAAMVGDLLRVMERALGAFPFNLVLQTSPVRQDASVARAFHWRIEILPRLSVPSGFELASDTFIVSLLPEDAATRLRAHLEHTAGAGRDTGVTR
jgi:UDPglucose--hexose-1-phosphate uridylyltransferase